MISKQKEFCYVDGVGSQTLYSFRGKSTDEKPVFAELGNASSFTEIDTGDLYYYDAETKTWIIPGGE